MSIKKLFNSTDKTREYLTDQEQKTAFKEIESSKNLQQLKTKQDSFLPQVDYSDPSSFAKFGSAYLYYKSAVERILDFYPYDGSDAELNAFYNKSLSIEKHIFNNLYPRRNGYISFCTGGWGALAAERYSSGYGLPSTLEDITFYGGPNISSTLTSLKSMEPDPLSSKFQNNNIYDTAIYDTAGLRSDYGSGSRESNLKSDFDNGVTVEFWTKTGSYTSGFTTKQVAFDMWNNELSSSDAYGRITIELTGGTGGGASSPFLITAQSGTLSSSAQFCFTSSIGQDLAGTLSDWGHYAFVLQNSGSDLVAKLYVNGYLNDTNTYTGTTLNELNSKNMVGRLGALLTAPSGTAVGGTLPSAYVGAGKMSGSLDEFRFWKVARNGGQIGKYWFDQIRGGVNTDIANTELGMYYKFNEGITGVTSVDSVVLDYGGRLCNGTWTGYTAASRNTGSAILSASAAIKEYEDPIIYSEHPDVISLKSELLATGSYHDSQNSGLVRNLVPAWLTEDNEISDQTDLDRICHILGVYFDKLHMQISALPTFRNLSYTSASHEPLPFSQHLPQSLGLYAPEIFIDSTILEKFKNRTDTKLLEGDVKQAKDLIYSNLYNNLAKIYKAKGTEKAIRNVLRCFNLDDNLVSFRVYSNNQQFELKTNLKQTRKNTKYANFNNSDAITAVVYQAADPHTNAENPQTAATATITITAYTELNAGDKVNLVATDGTNYDFTQGDQSSVNGTFEATISNNQTATNLMNVINTSSGPAGTRFTATVDGAVVTVTQATAGPSGNTTITLTDSGTAGMTKTNFTGGTSASRGYISGSQQDGYEDRYGFTAEASIVFPRFIRGLDTFPRDFLSASIFGMQTVNSGSALTRADTAFLTGAQDVANFQVHAIRDEEYSKNVYFTLTSSIDPHPFPTLTSSTFFDVYDDSVWNLSVRIKPSGYPLHDIVYQATSSTYDVIFRGVNNNLGTIANSFEATGSVSLDTAKNILKSDKRIYVGARNTNITGANLQKTDILASSVKYWTKYIDDTSLNQHLFDGENYGISGSYESPSPIDSGSLRTHNFNTLALDWYFGNVTSSNAAGNFYVTDLSSGSAEFRSSFGWMADVAGYQHSGKGAGFGASDSDVIAGINTNYFKFIDPEQVVSSDMVQVLSTDDQVFGLVEQVPNYVYTIEKSLYASVTEEILDFFAGAVDFHNLIGQPVNRYRARYKSLEYLRKIYFDRVQNIQTVERFTEYYKWFDDALSIIIGQLVPASANFVSDTYNTVESHVLERNKYKTLYPTLEDFYPEPAAALQGNPATPSYTGDEGIGVIPPQSPRSTKVRREYWRRRAETDAPEITSGDSTIDAQRQTFKNIMWSRWALSSSMPTLSSVDGTTYQLDPKQASQFAGTFTFVAKTTKNIKGGTNFDAMKRLGFTYNALYPAGPVNTDGAVFVPRNVLLAKIQDLVDIQELEQTDRIESKPNEKVKRVIKVVAGRNYEDGVGYTTTKSTLSFPFNIMSSSVKSGYNKDVINRVTASVEITNLHNDVYGEDMERPMQGPWSEYAAGGHQSRHVPLNKHDANKGPAYNNLDNYTTRPEAWKILLGSCAAATTGAIGMVGADYPWPEANALFARPYPMTASQKAVYYRDFVAKTPYVFKNIRLRSGSTILGNYRHNYEIVHTVGAYSNPRQFIKNQPTLPLLFSDQRATSSTITRTFLDIHRSDDGHYEFMEPYSISYLSANASQSSVIVSKFSNPGGLEVGPPGYRDVRSNEFSVYNGTIYRNLSVIKPSQGPSGSVSEATGAGGPGIRVADIHGYDYGLRSHLARHTARFGRDSLWVTDALAGASLDQLPGFHKVHRNSLPRMRLTGTSSAGTVISSSLYDNFYVQHQIPRSDRQYAWITGAMSQSTDLRYYGFMPMQGPKEGMYSSSADGFESFFPFMSASDFGSFEQGGQRGWGGSRQAIADIGFADSFIPTAFGNLNLNVYEPITTTGPSGSNASYMNTLGYPSGTALTDAHETTNTQYRNFTLVPAVGPGPGTPPSLDGCRSAMFHALLLKRNGIYGWGTFAQTHLNDHPILKDQRARNKLSIEYLTPGTPQEFDLRPVSVRGLPVFVNFDYETEHTVASETIVRTSNATLKTSYNNEFIYFNSRSLDDYFNIPTYLEGEVTPFEQLIALKDRSGIALNWVHYKESLFPSLKNEFASTVTQRVGYDNLMWRDSLAGRINLGSKTILSNSMGISKALSASCWPLDAPFGFLTRTRSPVITTLTSAAGELLITNTLRQGGALLTGAASTTGQYGDTVDNRRANPAGVAGELQNTYSWLHQTASNLKNGNIWSTHAEYSDAVFALGTSPAALYARKQTLASPLSVNPPNFSNPSCSVRDLGPFGGLRPHTTYGFKAASLGAGEAMWDAPDTAGYFSGNINPNGIKTLQFVTAASKPWYNDYGKFKDLDLKYKNRGYSIVPEFRISERIENYLMGDVDDFNDLSIPGTSFDSRDANFYKDFSNSDFMEKFLDVRKMSDLEAKQIKLTCRAVLKFNPYKGFYPADRTLQLVSQFSKSYGQALTKEAAAIDPFWAQRGNFEPRAPALRMVLQPLFAPGILYNSIKSGMACDWPMVSDGARLYRANLSSSIGAPVGADGENYAWYPTTGWTDNYVSGTFWDKRLPFETIINPGAHMNGLSCTDMEPNPLVSLGQFADVSASIAGSPADNLYTLMASNFVAEVGDFFLEGGKYSRLESKGVSLGTMTFPSGAVYGARLRMKTSFSGSRSYEFESGSFGDNTWFTKLGCGAVYANATTEADRKSGVTTGSFEIPQDPSRNAAFRRDFVMYSRTTAFGPPVTSRSPEALLGLEDAIWQGLGGLAGAGTDAFPGDTWRQNANQFYASSSASGAMDCMNGYNWAYTPPYYHGEAWCDFVFRPSLAKTYTLEQIVSELSTSYYRVEPGPQTASWHAVTTTELGVASAVADTFRNFNYSSLIRDSVPLSGAKGGAAINKNNSPYSSTLINDNAMQLNSTLNLFGVENVYKKRYDKFGREILTETEVVGKKWIIQPKFETPMLNFADIGSHAVVGASTGSSTRTKTVPMVGDGTAYGFGADTAANGMWHQFGTRPESPNQGIFLEIGDIPASWLQYHYSCVSESSIYNDFNPESVGSVGKSNLHETMESLSELMGFSEQSSRTRMGELAEQRTIKEAIVAVPYIITDVAMGGASMGGASVLKVKQFINIPLARYEAATAEREETEIGDSLDAAGQSIRRLISKMKDYVLPKRFDFLRNPLVDPIVMYMFEFKYKLDKDDLSYIWQNLAPRKYERMHMQKDVVAHELFNTELLTEQNIMENPNLRWMVFKVKQRSQKTYTDKIVPKFGVIATDPIIAEASVGDYPLLYNWPYDYLSIVESVKLEAEVLYNNDERELAEEMAASAGTSAEGETSELNIPTATSAVLDRTVRDTVSLDFDEKAKVLVKKVSKGDPIAATKLSASTKKKKKLTKLRTPRKGKTKTKSKKK